MVHGWLNNLHARIYPPICILCGAPGAADRELCGGCFHGLPWNRHACPRCAAPLPTETRTLLCGSCLRAPPPWEAAACPLLYDWPLNQLIQRFKFNGDLAMGRLLGELLAQFLAAGDISRPDLLVPVPLHAARLRERGFNQALELTRLVSQRLRLPLAHSLCVRVRDTAVQSQLRAAARRRNLRDAFRVTLPLHGVHVAVIDDVLTTGATVAALTGVLRAAGAARIQVWSLARAGHPA